MADFTRVKTAGWGTNVLLASAEMNQLDIDHAKAPNVVDGGGPYPGDLVWSGKHTRSGSGARSLIRYDSSLADANADITTAFDVWRADAGVYTAGRTYKLRNAGAEAGDQILVCIHMGGSFTLTITRESNSTIATIDCGVGTGWLLCVNDGTNWLSVAWGGSMVVA